MGDPQVTISFNTKMVKSGYRARPFRACGSNWWGGHMPFPAVGQRDGHQLKETDEDDKYFSLATKNVDLVSSFTILGVSSYLAGRL